MKHVASEISYSSNGRHSRSQPRLDPQPHVSLRAPRGQGFATQAASTVVSTDTKDAAGMMLSTRELRPFKLERFFSEHEFTAPHLLCCSDPEPMLLSTLIGMADADCQQRWNNLSLAYTETLGLPALRQEIADQYGNEVGPDKLVVLAPEEGIFLAMTAILRAGDHVVCTAPGYQSLSEVARSIGCEVTPWDVTACPDGSFHFDVEQLVSLVRPDTRCVIVNFPHNPTGTLPSAAEWAEIVRVCSGCGAYLFSDEMYRGMEADPTRRLTPACDLYDRAVSLSGLSKAYGLPGLRVGWLASQDKSILDRVAQLKDYTTICMAAPVEVLALIALRNRGMILGRTNGILEANKRILDGFFANNTNAFQWLPPPAGSVAFPSLISSEPIESFCERCVREAGVLLLPATVYDHPPSVEQRRFRLGFGRNSLRKGMKALADYLDRRPPAP